MKLKIRNNKNNETKNAATKQQVNNPKSEPVMHEVDVIGMMTALKRDGHVKLSDHFKDAEVVEPVSEEKPTPSPSQVGGETAKPVTIKRKAASEREQNGTRSSSAEREQARQKVKVTLRKKSDVRGKKEEKPQPTTYSVVLLPTKDGGQWPKLYGFKSEEEAKAVADKLPKSVTASWDYGPNGEGRETKTKHWCLKMGKRYCDAAKQLCAALNSGDKKSIAKAITDSQNVYELAKAEGKAADEIKKAEREKPTPNPSQREGGNEKNVQSKTYSDKDVAEMLRNVLAGKELPKEVAALMAA